jgi:molybdenum cofactor biosynthesis enzyme MoaA
MNIIVHFSHQQMKRSAQGDRHAFCKTFFLFFPFRPDVCGILYRIRIKHDGKEKTILQTQKLALNTKKTQKQQVKTR